MNPLKPPRIGPLPVVPDPAVVAAAPPGVPERKSSSVASNAGPHWQGRGIAAAAIARKDRDAKEKAGPRDFIAEACAAIPASRCTDEPLTAAIIIAQALDRLGETMLEAAAIASYKRT